MQDTISGDFAIRNIETGKNIRPYNAGTSGGNAIILYPHHEWKCLTWQFSHIEGAIYQLQIVYTQKTFEPVTTAEMGVALWQQPLNEDSSYWEFIEQEDGAYAIRLVDTDLYITVSSDKTNEPIILPFFCTLMACYLKNTHASYLICVKKRYHTITVVLLLSVGRFHGNFKSETLNIEELCAGPSMQQDAL